MASKDLPWHWVVETLAGFKEADPSLLRDAISTIPDFMTGAPETVRERVSIRYLEEFLNSGRGDAPNLSVPDRPLTLGLVRGIDVGQTCEEVLCRNLRTVTTTHNHDKSRAELCTHEFHQFILHKRATLPKSSLDLLKESVIQGCCQAVSSLKGPSGLSRPSQVNYLHCNSGVECQIVKKLKLSNNDGEIQPINRSSADLASDSGKVLLQNDPTGSQQHFPENNVSDSDRRNYPRDDIVSSWNSIQLLEKSSVPQPHRMKTAILNDGESPRQSSAPLAPETDNANLQEDYLGSRQHMQKHGVSDVQMTNHLHKEIDSVGGDKVHLMSIMPQLPCEESGRLHYAPLSGNGRNVNTHVGEIDCFNGDPVIVRETQSHSDGFDDLSSNSDPNDELFTAEKHHFLTSQVHANDESITGNWTEKGLCIKCDKGGQLLSCSSSRCSIAVHESCLGPLVNFDEKDLFYCPFCSYLRANSAYKKAKNVVRQARKNLSAFISRNLAQLHEKEQPPTGSLRGKSQERVVGNVNHQSDVHTNQHQRDKSRDDFSKAKEQCQKTKAANVGEDRVSSRYDEVPPSVRICDVFHHNSEINHEKMVNNHHNVTNVQHNQLIGAANITNNDTLPCRGTMTSTICQKTEVNLINRRSEAADISNLPFKEMDTSHNIYAYDVSKRKRKELGLGVQQLKNLEQVKNDHDTERETLSSRSSDGNAKRRRHNAAIGKTHRPHGSAENQNRESLSLGQSRKCKNRPKRHSNSILPNCRRIPLSWTTEEEEFLKDAMQKFEVNRDGSLPWTKILEFGRHVFHRTRQTIDLKDKWRNIKNKEGSK